MKSLLSQCNRFFERAPALLLPQRAWVMSVFCLLTVLAVYGTFTRFTMDMSLESWFQDEDPIKLTLDQFRRQFGSDDGIYVVYEAADGDIFSEQSLRTLQQLHEALDNARVQPVNAMVSQPLRRLERIDSLYNARYQQAQGDTLISHTLLRHDFPDNAAEREGRRRLAQSQPLFERAFYSPDFRFGGIRLKTDFGTVLKTSSKQTAEPVETDWLEGDEALLLGEQLVVDEQVTVTVPEYEDMQMDEYLQFMQALRGITERPEYRHFTFYYTGNAPMMEFAMQSMEQASWLLVLMVVLVMGLLWLLFHSLSAVVWPVVVIAASAFWTIGLASWLGVVLSNMVSLTFMLVLAVGIADCVHVMSSYRLYRHEGLAHREAMIQAYRKTGLPILLTSVTTMAGMSALLLSDIPQIRIFGVTSALAVWAAFLLTIFILPVMMDLWHPNPKPSTHEKRPHRPWLQPWLDRIPGGVSRKARWIVLLYFGVFGCFLYGTTQVQVDSNFAELTREGSVIRVTYELVDQHMMGGQNMEIMFDFGRRDALKNPAVLKSIDRLQQHVEKAYAEYVVKTFSLADYVKDTYKIMQGGDEAYARIPDDARLTAQLLYLFDNANPTDRRSLVSDDYRRSHLSLQLRNAGSYEYSQFFTDIQGDIPHFFAHLQPDYPDMALNGTGSLALMMALIDHISWTQLKSFSFALLIITALLMLTLGSVQAGLISVVPNLLPAFFTFGVMGLLGIPLDTDTLIIAPLIIGIAVDDTIHFVAHYRDAWYECGNVEQALSSTIREVGQAVTFTTIILGVGFSTLAFSDYLGLAKTGIFGSLAIVVALSSDLLLLPALIQWLRPDLGRQQYLLQQSLEVDGER